MRPYPWHRWRFIGPGTLAALAVAAGLLPPFTYAELLSIENTVLKVTYDTSSCRFTMGERGLGKPVVFDGRPFGAVSNAAFLGNPPLGKSHSADSGKLALPRAEVRSTTDAVFGKGRQICITLPDGSKSELELYPELPFLGLTLKRRVAQS